MVSQLVYVGEAFRYYILSEGSEAPVWISAVAALVLSVAAVERWRRRVLTVRARLRIIGRVLGMYALSLAVIVAGVAGWDRYDRKRYEAYLNSPPKTLFCRVPPSPELRAELAEVGSFSVRTTVSAIPVSVRSALANTAHEGQLRMAEPGARWRATDTDPFDLPTYRLGRVALSKSLCVLFYEAGGFFGGGSYHTDVFRLAPEDAKLIWSAYSFKIIDGPADLLALINGGGGLVVQ
jgi:hypothetical protein